MLSHLHQAIFHLFAILSAQESQTSSEEAELFLKAFLSDALNQSDLEKGLHHFRTYLAKYQKSTGKKGLALSSVKYLKTLQSMSDNLCLEERHLLCIRLLEFVSGNQRINNQLLDFVKLTAEVFSIEQDEFLRIQNVILDKVDAFDAVQELMPEQGRIIYLSPTEIYIKMPEANAGSELFFRMQYDQKIDLPAGGKLIYSDILKAAGAANPQSSRLILHDLKYTVGNQCLFNGLSLKVDAPALVAVMGQSGAGKSSLLKVIAGIFRPDAGQVGFTMNNPCILYVPQEDSVNPDIPVKRQIELLAKKYGINEPEKRTEELLKRTNLEDKAHVRPGLPGESALSGGERKRLAIACGLVADPDVLICDEPSSGLSFEDSEQVVRFLRDAANQDCMVICSLHQPDAAVMSYFDDMLYLDVGGRPVYYGEPAAFEQYLSTATERTNQAVFSGSQNSSLARAESIVRQKRLDEYGRTTSERRYSPEFWKGKYDARKKASTSLLPSEKLSSAGTRSVRYIRQFRYLFESFRHRRLFFALILAYAPVLAVMLATVCRFSEANAYQADYNPHFPVFFIMSILVALFSGLIFSLGEFSRQTPERKREWTYERTNTRFATAQIALLLPFGLFQAVVYSVIVALILDVTFLIFPLSLMYFVLWLFSTATGLILSLYSRGRLWVYLLVPVLLIPQIIFSGAMISWEKFPGNDGETDAPFVSHFFVASRAYEGLKTEAIYRHPDSDYSRERTYYLSLLYLQDVLPLWGSECKTQLTDEAAAQCLYNALPPDVKGKLSADLADDSQKLEAATERIFTATLATQEKMKKPFPALWYSTMKTDMPAAKCLNGNLWLNAYPYYRTGSLRSPNAAFVRLGGITIRHINWSVLLIAFGALLQYAFILSGKYKWPWKR